MATVDSSSKILKCVYVIIKVCRVDIQLQQFAQDNVKLVPDKMALLTNTELTQYFIQTWNLDYNQHGSYIERVK